MSLLLIPHQEMDRKMFSPCILLIDNDVKLLVKLEAALKRAGYRVLTAHTSEQAAYLAQAALPEVIVCSEADDFDVRNTLTEDSQTASIPFISFTEQIDPHELVARVNAVIRSHAFR